MATEDRKEGEIVENTDVSSPLTSKRYYELVTEAASRIEKAEKQNGSFRITEDLGIRIPALPKAGVRRLWIEERDETNMYDELKEEGKVPEGAVTLVLGTVLSPEEEFITSQQLEGRMHKFTWPFHKPLLSYQHALWLVEHQTEFPEFMALLGKVYIDFPGVYATYNSVHTHHLRLVQMESKWGCHWGSQLLYCGLHQLGRVAVAKEHLPEAK